MTNPSSRVLAPTAVVLTLLVSLACAPANPETEASPVQAATRTVESIKGA